MYDIEYTDVDGSRKRYGVSVSQPAAERFAENLNLSPNPRPIPYDAAAVPA